MKSRCNKKKSPNKAFIWIIQGVWVPKLVFSNTEQKLNTKNDEKAFAVARFVILII